MDVQESSKRCSGCRVSKTTEFFGKYKTCSKCRSPNKKSRSGYFKDRRMMGLDKDTRTYSERKEYYEQWRLGIKTL